MSAPEYLRGKKIAVLDFGGQYAHLIASRIRRLGAYSEIVSPSELTVEEARREFAGLIYSGGPASVYDRGAPTSSPTLLEAGLPVLGICYGHQLIMQQAGGKVRAAASREYGPAHLEVLRAEGLLEGESETARATVWMSHGDEVDQLPEGFITICSTEDCQHAAVADFQRRIYGIQFHPEVRHSERGDFYLRNFLGICGVADTWSLQGFLELETERIRQQVGARKVFLLISGGVDSTVAFALLARVLPHDHLLGLFVDTGFMRDREGAEVEAALRALGVDLHTAHAESLFFERLQGVFEPEAKRKIIGELFLEVQASETTRLGLNAADWFLGQGTIYPDTIESGATRHSHKIKTHHNRVPAIEALIAAGRVVEPLRDLYKDEVRELGRLLGLPDAIVDRHPFPGPGLAVRCLCMEKAPVEDPAALEVRKALLPDSSDPLAAELRNGQLQGALLPFHSVGVQGDQRSYARCVALWPQGGLSAMQELHWPVLLSLARKIPNRFSALNRVLLAVAARPEVDIAALRPRPHYDLNEKRVALLQKADRIVHNFQIGHGLYSRIWQFPVVLAPGGSASGGESLILRPIVSTDAMTAAVFEMDILPLRELSQTLIALDGIDAVFYDLTSKPPGTIEWE
ncbi:MAG: glutamine-hydrolyzing GMP synthase [Leptospirales bacterium]|nr:glutamine-hydrolyzing GMP synthase [Leptospirales bacterium]